MLIALISFASLLQVKYVPPQLKQFTAPVHPAQALVPALVIVEAQVQSSGEVGKTELRLGAPGFSEEVLRSVNSWKFTPASEGAAVESPVAVVLMFRERSIYSFGPPEMHFQWPARRDAPPLPRTVTPAMYPPASVAEGTVLLALDISSAGQIQSVRVMRDIASLTEEAVRTVRKWSFQPATRNGENVPGTAVVGISFLRPAIEQTPAH